VASFAQAPATDGEQRFVLHYGVAHRDADVEVALHVLEGSSIVEAAETCTQTVSGTEANSP